MATAGELDKKTKRIDKLINKTNSGKNAWFAGELLYGIKKNEEYKNKQITSFAIYVRQELNISESKAYAYINIYLIYNEEDIGDLMLVTHLSYLAEQNQNIREVLLKVLKEIDDEKSSAQHPDSTFNATGNIQQKGENIVKLKKGTKATSSKGTTDLRPSYDKGIITAGVNLLNSADKSGINVTAALAKEAIDFATEMNQRNLGALPLPNETGNRLVSEYFPTLPELYQFEPISEMGLVALFCTMFHLIRDIKFKYDEKKNLRFKSIVYVRNAFPDARIEFATAKGATALDVEFELNSSNYLSHQHNKSDKECHLIIAWEHDLSKTRLEKFGKEIPPIISIKKVLETGKIVLE